LKPSIGKTTQTEQVLASFLSAYPFAVLSLGMDAEPNCPEVQHSILDCLKDQQTDHAISRLEGLHDAALRKRASSENQPCS
jgi:hypothetical protein